jgi:Arm DNA-binding domain/Phage integrase central domain
VGVSPQDPDADRMSLTDALCRNATCPEGRAYKRFSDGGGLRLEVTQSGSKLWRWKYRHAGREKLLALGTYPDVSLREARKARDAARLQLAAGIDPSTAKQEAKRAGLALHETSCESIARRWWADWSANKSKRHAGYVMTRLEADAFPVIGAKPVDELTAPAFVRLAKKIEARGADDIARRVLQTCGQVMRYCPPQLLESGDILRTTADDHALPSDVSSEYS